MYWLEIPPMPPFYYRGRARVFSLAPQPTPPATTMPRQHWQSIGLYIQCLKILWCLCCFLSWHDNCTVFVFVFLSIRFDLVYIEARSNTLKGYKESNPYSKLI